MGKRDRLAEMIAELQSAKKEAKQTLRKWEKNIGRAREADNGMCRICGFNVCTEVHHIVPRSKGGSGKLSNLITLCPNHHAMADRGLIPAEELHRAVQRRTPMGRVAAAGEACAYLSQQYPGDGASFQEIEAFRALLKAEVPNRFGAIYGSISDETRKALNQILNDKFNELFFKTKVTQ